MNLQVAYFTMEIGLTGAMPTFAGGLGMLAADILRSCADTGVNAACMTMRWQHGYQQQTLESDGRIRHEERSWDPSSLLRKLDHTVTIMIGKRAVVVGAWKLDLVGTKGSVPIFFLDTDLPVNAPDDRSITQYLYGGGQEMRIKQEIVLGIGGVRMLRALGYADVMSFHMNEGHCAFLTLELLKERNFSDDAVRTSCSFTTHTPVAAGHDVFPYDLATETLGDMLPWHIRTLAGENALSMTELAMRLSHYTCGVSKLHGEVARAMLGNPSIDFVTNGAHHPTWASPEMQRVFDSHLAGWREKPELLRGAHDLPDDEVRRAHDEAKARLIDEIQKRTGRRLDPHKLLLTEARRIVPYKQPELLYANEDRLLSVLRGKGQIVHSGNSHEGDSFSHDVIARLQERAHRYGDDLPIVYVPSYDPELAKLLTAGSDLWLNTPMRLKEASGTSGMKAALNGTLNLSILDGWWAEGYLMDPESGWRIGPEKIAATEDAMRTLDAEDLYTQLETEIVPEFFQEPATWHERMKRSIALMATFNTHRCVEEYQQKAWSRAA